MGMLVGACCVADPHESHEDANCFPNTDPGECPGIPDDEMVRESTDLLGRNAFRSGREELPGLVEGRRHGSGRGNCAVRGAGGHERGLGGGLMSVRFAEEVIRKLRDRGVLVSDQWTDWRHHGTGQPTDFQGAIMHHTATDYGDAFPALVSGRADLTGPLCNSAGCADGSITVVAAGTANHAGASGGGWARPFPDTRDFSPVVWGHEIVYPGTSPMTEAQWRSMVVLGQVICEILGKGPEWIRGHYETAVDGRWDPGYAPGKWIDMNQVRAEIGRGSGEARGSRGIRTRRPSPSGTG